MKKTHQIVMADDDEDDRLLVGSLFEQHCPECTLSFAENGQELIDMIENSNAPPPALILLDLNMPILNGFGALQRIKTAAHLQKIPVVILSTSAEPVDVNRSYALGVNAYLTKPARHDELKAMVLKLSGFWFNLASLPDTDNSAQ